MLLELRIENLLLIERAELRLGGGLNAITGETGAGKTILAHSLDLLLGGKARSGIVRPGAEEAWVEGVFSLPEGLLEEPALAAVAERLPTGAGEVALGRRIGASGRTSAFIAGRSAQAAELRSLGSRLLAFYGQHEHRRLMLGSAQLEVLDGFAGAEHLEARARYRSVHAETLGVASELAELREREGARERDLDLLRFELAEIESVAPRPDEEEELSSARERLRHAEALRAATAGALEVLTAEGGIEQGGGARSLMAEAEAALSRVAGVDGELDALAERVGAVAVELDDLAAVLRSRNEAVDSDPAQLEAVEERLAAIDRLKRKHGGSIEAVIEHGERCRQQIERLGSAEERTGELESRLAELEPERAELAALLTRGRKSAAEELAKRVASELAELSMEGAKLEVRLEAHPEELGPSGAETVEFLLATNPGLPLAPLKEAASGGELSRVMLALTGLDGGEGARTLVFDEIDAGIGGATARAVGERLRELSGGRQVICITHLPQVASQAETHFRISKSARKDATVASVERVGGDELVAEIVRMLGGERGDAAASRHARELLEAA